MKYYKKKTKSNLPLLICLLGAILMVQAGKAQALMALEECEAKHSSGSGTNYSIK